ncbi:MAG: hypothetical protein QOJ64_651 [Acidobacteriota bacterium]|nr:hypothetical protein [Acidobacteriota bacterium]
MLKRSLAIVFSCLIVFGAFTERLHAQAPQRDQIATRVREVTAAPAAEVTVILNEQFFNSLLDVIFTRLKAPSYPLSLTSITPDERAQSAGKDRALAHPGPGLDTCASMVTLQREMDGVRTAVRFRDGKVVAPLAFSGSYNVALIGCVNFQGWADTVINLDFDRSRQSLSARVSVEDIHLSNVPSLASGVVLKLVQGSIDRRINPIEILPAAQLSARIPVAGSGGVLRMRATEILPEVVDGTLRLHIFCEFSPDN